MQPLHVVRAGHGPRAVLVHGSATDHTTWSIQLASPLRERFELVAYDRRSATSIAAQVADLAQVIGDAPALVIGSSFGAIIALELARSRLAPCAGLVLIEPPMAPTDAPQDIVATARAAIGGEPWPAPPATVGFLDQFDRVVAEAGGPAAATFFLRTVLGEAAFAKIPRAFLERSTAKWAEIRADCLALAVYQPRYPELAGLDLPVRLVGGERSAPYFRVTLDALAAALPNARIEIVPRAGHMLHAEAPSRFAELVTRFADELGLR
jgi:pimeloyl-ACP methyl ester carboxylesterase